MKAIILAAGEGLRMRPLTLHTPKPMLSIHGRPLLQYIINALPEAVTEIILVVGYKREAIQEYFGEKFGTRTIRYVVQKKKTGTAKALQLCRRFIKSNERFLLLYADDLHDKKSIEKCLKKDRALLVHCLKNPKRFGVVVIDKKGIILDIEEKPEYPKSNLAVIGVYVLDGHIFNYSSAKHSSGEYFLTTMLEQWLRDYPVYAVKTKFWHPIGYPADLKTAEKILKNKNKSNLTSRLIRANRLVV